MPLKVIRLSAVFTMPIKVRFAVFYRVYAVKSLRLLTGFADFPVFLWNTTGKSERNENFLSQETCFGTTLTIRHSRFAALTLAKLVASLALHPPSSATGSGGFVPRAVHAAAADITRRRSRPP